MTNFPPVGALIGIALAMSGCTGSGEARPEGIEVPPGPLATAEAPDGSVEFFSTQEQDDLFFRVNSLGSWATVNADYDGAVTRDQRLQLTGMVTDPTGTRMFAITRVELAELRDEDGRDLLWAGQVNLSPAARAPGYFSPPAPGSARSASFSATVQGLPSLPSGLSVAKGRVVVEVHGELRAFDLAPLVGEGMVELAPGVSARVRTYPGHRDDMLSAQVEYRLTRPTDKPGPWAPPMVVGLTIYDQKDEVIFQNQRGQEHFSKNRVFGVIPMNYGLGDRRAVRWELEVAVDTREIVFEFAGRNVALAGARASE